MLLSLAALVGLASAQHSLLAISNTPITSSCIDYLGPYGTAGDTYHLHRAQQDCVSLDTSFAKDASIVPLLEDKVLIYVQEAGVDASVRGNEPSFSTFLESIAESRQAQMTFSTPDFEVIYSTKTSALISVSPQVADQIDAYLPRFVVPILVHTASESAGYIPVPAPSRKRVLDWLNNISHKSEIDKIVDSISVDYMQSRLEYLTGESSDSDIQTRYATSNDAKKAARWLKDEFEKNGAQCELHVFRLGYSPNVICRYAADASVKPEGTIILGAHYDSRAGPMMPYIRAPGANDDGSGVASLLGISHAIKKHNLAFSNDIEFVAFSGEEQGLVGSSFYAARLRKEGAKVLLMIQADMVGYRRKDEGRQIAFPGSYATTEASLYLANLTHLYSEGLEQGYTQACCSDHQSFYIQGIASTQVFERIGPIADPMYHNRGDLSRREGYDFEQIRAIAKVTFSAVLDTSLISTNEDDSL